MAGPLGWVRRVAVCRWRFGGKADCGDVDSWLVGLRSVLSRGGWGKYRDFATLEFTIVQQQRFYKKEP
jgi:hypothetical protein